MSKLNYVAHFGSINFGAIRDGVVSAHLASNLTPDLYKSVVKQYPFPLTDFEIKEFTRVLIEYAEFARSQKEKDFFFWLTEN